MFFVVGALLALAPPPLQRPAVAIAATPVAVPPPFFAQMEALAQRHYLPVAAAQMCLVRSLSDVVAQMFAAYHTVPLQWASTVAWQCSAAGCESQFTLDIVHVLAMGLVGLTTSGCGGALWLRHLEAQMGPTDGSGVVALQKSAADFMCYAPIVNCANLLLVPLLCGHPVGEALTNMQAHLPELMKLELMLFGPFNLLIFSRADLISPDLRPTCKAMLSFVFSVGLGFACA